MLNNLGVELGPACKKDNGQDDSCLDNLIAVTEIAPYNQAISMIYQAPAKAARE